MALFPPATAHGPGMRHNNNQFISDGCIPTKLQGVAEKQVNNEMNSLMQRLDSAMNQAGTTIMMPGGEVMTFNGMDTISDAQLYAHVKYALGVNDVHQT